MNSDATAMMRAAVVSHYGGPEVVAVTTVPKPVPRAGEVRVRVVATTVSSGDARVRARRVPAGMGFLMRLALGWSAPRQPVLGTECSGIVDAVGPGVTRFAPGDAVIAFVGARMGTHAEYVCVPASKPMVTKPEGLSHAEAASLLFGATTAWHYLHRAAQIRAGERVLIVGAAGAVGSAAVQIAAIAGAQVTAVCSGANRARVEGLGAARVIDYTREDFTRRDETWDVIFDCVGSTRYAACAPRLARGGRFLTAATSLWGQLAAPFLGRRAGHRVIAGVAPERQSDVEHLVALAAAGKLRPVIDAELPFEAIADAHRRVDGGHKRGAIVLALDASDASAHAH